MLLTDAVVRKLSPVDHDEEDLVQNVDVEVVVDEVLEVDLPQCVEDDEEDEEDGERCPCWRLLPEMVVVEDADHVVENNVLK